MMNDTGPSDILKETSNRQDAASSSSTTRVSPPSRLGDPSSHQRQLAVSANQSIGPIALMITIETHKCAESFRFLLRWFTEQNPSLTTTEAGALDNSTGSIASEAVEQFERYRIWCANIAPAVDDQISLEYRLRDASNISNQITALLQDLNESVSSCKYIGGPLHSQGQLLNPTSTRPNDFSRLCYRVR
jgi:hypothetical protein